MNFCVRPSKSFLFDLLENKLRQYKTGTGIDAASAGLKNRRMFKTEKYFGIDIDLALLEKGLEKDKSPNTFGILADIAKLDNLPEGMAEVVVSTNTLYCLQTQLKFQAIENLSRLTAPEGIFMCDLVIDKDLDYLVEILKKYFKKVEIVYYCNSFDRFYEKLFEKNGFLGSHPIAGTKPLRLFAWLLSRLNFLTCKIKSINSGAFVICKDKNNENKKVFDTRQIKKISGRLFTLLD